MYLLRPVCALNAGPDFSGILSRDAPLPCGIDHRHHAHFFDLLKRLEVVAHFVGFCLKIYSSMVLNKLLEGSDCFLLIDRCLDLGSDA